MRPLPLDATTGRAEMKNKESPFNHIEKLYRIDSVCYAAPLDEFENPIGEGRKELHIDSFDVIKRTPCGVWIRVNSWSDEKRFVNLKSRKKYACETIDDAKLSFIARKNRQIKILSARLRTAKIFLEQAISGRWK